MPSSARPNGRYCAAREEVNDRIRILMSQPASHARTEEWTRLLRQWVDGCPGCARCGDQPAAA